jgi:ketosteroid isomerase-like protein
MPPVEVQLLAANEAFYAAFDHRDAQAMDDLWAAEAEVICIHPGWDLLVGRDQVMKSWRAILDNPSAPRVRCRRAHAQVCGQAAMVVCIEEIDGSELIATNVFTREGDSWKLVHHQAGPVARRRDVEPRARRARQDMN